MVNEVTTTMAGRKSTSAITTVGGMSTTNSAQVVSARTLIILLAVHAYLGVLLKSDASLATMHAVLVGVAGLYFSLRDGMPERTYLMIGYIVGSEILWRMTRADIFWMYADYLVILLSGLSAMRFRKTRTGISTSLVYVLLLLLSIPETLASLPFEESRKGLAFNLAGPVAFGISVFSASRLELHKSWLVPIAFAAVLPVVSVAVLATRGAVAGGVVFSAHSNYAASGGYAPNQVSTLMSYGSVILFALVIMRHTWSRYKAVFFILMVYFSVQGVLTFSRGGVLNTLAFMMLFLPYLLRDNKTRLRLLSVSVVLIPLLTLVVAPAVEDLTGSAIESRYSTSGNTTGRTQIMKEELALFRENPILGVGPGMSTYIRSRTYGTFHATTHTEYTRLLAEHGIVGALALFFFIITFKSLYRRAKYPRAKGFVLAVLGWSLTMFVHAATRTMTFGFLAVLVALWIQAESSNDD